VLTLKLYLLGSPQIELDGESVRVDTRKVTALLAYLAVTGESHTRDALATLFWPESDRARSALRWTLASLKKAIGETWLEIERESLGLKQGDGFWLDAAQFDRLMATCQTHDHPAGETCPDCAGPLGQAVELYRGDFLAGFSLRDSPGFDDWQFFQTERLRGQMMGALERLVGYHSARREYEPAIAYAQRWLALDPLQEQAHCRLIKLYTWAGQRADALRQYEECLQILKEELGVPPQKETRQLYQAIEQGRSPSHPLRPLPPHLHNLPPQPTPFVGREKELDEIERLLADTACRLLTLIGPGGIGKTRLALQAAEQEVEAFAHGVYFVPLAPLSAADFIVPTIASALKFSLHGQSDPREQLLDFLRSKEMLLVLDNFEHLLEGAELLTTILTDASQVKLLVTSRERLNLRWEQLLDVEGLRFPKNGKRDGTEDYGAIQLFSQLAHRSDPKIPFSKEKPHVVRICQLVEGMPLAIELASAQVRERSCEEIAEQIEHRLNILSTTLRDMPVRHRSLEAAFDHSWELLTDEERHAFSKLSVFRGGFQAEAAERVTGALPALLDSLVAKSLLRQSPAGRFEMLEALRQYGAEKLAQAAGEQEKNRDQHCEYFATFLQQHEPALRGKDQVETLKTIGKDIENIRVAWSWAVERAKRECVESCLEGLFQFYDIQSWFQEGERAFGQAAQALLELDLPLEKTDELGWKLLARQGSFLGPRRLCHYEQAKEKLQKSLTAFRALGHEQEMAFCLVGLASIAAIQEDHDKAIELLEQALLLAKSTNARHLEARVLRGFGNFFSYQGKYAEAKACTEQAQQTFREIGDRRGESQAVLILGGICWYQGDYAGARAHYEQALAFFDQIGDREGKDTAFHNLGVVFRNQGDYARAIACHEKVAQSTQELGNRGGTALVLNNLSLAYTCLGDYATGKARCKQSLRISQEIGDRKQTGSALSNLGMISHHLGDDQAAQEYSRKGLQILRKVGERHLEGYALTYLGHALAGLGRLTKAIEVYQQALDLRCQMGQHHLARESQSGLVRVFLAQGDLEQAQNHAEDMLTYLQNNTLDGVLEPFAVYLTCYHFLRTVQDPRALNILTTAYHLLQEQAAKISDEDMRRSFLENVAAHRDILREFAERAIAYSPFCSKGRPVPLSKADETSALSDFCQEEPDCLAP